MLNCSFWRFLSPAPQKFASGLLYVSDHGESLGENNVYLHGMPYAVAAKEQIHVPMLLWMSETMKKYAHIDYSCLREKTQSNKYEHNHLFHSLMGLMEISSDLYDVNQDLFKECRTN